jgi:hypothetical protein
MIVEALVASELISVVLVLVVIYFFFRAYRLRRSLFLLGLVLGFSFLAASYVFLGMFLLYSSNLVFSGFFLWLRLIMQSYGFAFIAFSYYFSSNPERTAKYFLVLISAASFISVFLVLGVLVVAPPFLALPSVRIVDEAFRLANLFFLGYVIFYLVRKLELPHEQISGLVWAPLAFSLLWLAQFSMLIWGVDGSQTAFVAAHAARLASLILFIRVYYRGGT